MEIGVACDGLLVLAEMAASLGDDGIEIVDGVEVGVSERLIDERPQVLGGLEFRAMGRLVDEPDAIGNGEVLRTVPAGIVELEHDGSVAPGTGLARQGFE